MMRRFHRWVSPIIIIFMTVIALSGTYMAFERWNNGGPGAGPGAGPGGGPDRPALDSGRPAEAGADRFGNDPGAANTPPFPGRDRDGERGGGLGQWMHQLHTGEMFGKWGKAYSIASGLALTFFCVSGLWMYVSMFRARMRVGRKTFFWK